MYAIIATGGKQYKVSEGDIIKVEKLNAEKDATVSFDVVVVSKDSDIICGSCMWASIPSSWKGRASRPCTSGATA